MNAIRHAILVGFLSAMMAFPPSAIMAQPPATPAAESTIVGLPYVPDNAAVIAQLQVERLANSPVLWAYPTEVIEAFGKKYLGFNPMKVTGITYVMLPPEEGSKEFGMYGVVHTSETLTQETFFAGIAPLVESVKSSQEAQETFPGLKGKIFAIDGFPGETCAAHLLDEHTFLIGSETIVAELAKAGPQQQLTHPAQLLVDNSKGADFSAVMNNRVLLDSPTPLPADEQFLPVFEKVQMVRESTDSISVRVNLIESASAVLKLDAIDEDAAQRLEEFINASLDSLKARASFDAERDLQSDNPLEVAMGKYQLRSTTQLFDSLKPERKGKSLVLKYEQDPGSVAGANVAILAVMVALLLPAIQQAREAARRARATNNLRELGLGMHFFHDTMHRFPAQASTDSKGKKLLSWRVHLLPYLDQNDLYERFHLDEPWDSEHNKKLIQLMPDVYRSQDSVAPEFHTTYLVPVGKYMVFEEPNAPNQKTGRSFADILDGTSNTAMIVNVNDDASVIWTKPEDLEVDLENVSKHLPKSQQQDTYILCCDARIRVVPPTAPDELLRLLFLRNDGKPIPR